MVKDMNLPVVVGVDGSEQSDRAVRYAVREARRRGVGVMLVHAVHETAPMAAMLPLYSVEAFTEVGRRLVEDGTEIAHEVDPQVAVKTSVRAGGRVGVLVELGEHASAIVLGHRSRSLAGRVLTSSTTTGVAARAHCPVISVPDAWSEAEDKGRVVVGVDESDASHDALVLAFHEAARRKAALVVLHAWKLPTAYDDIGYVQVSGEEWMASATEQLDKMLAPFREVHPDVTVEVDLRHEFAGPAMVSATEDADLMVVGRRGHGAPLGIYLGSLARMLIREGACPIEVAPQHGRHEPKAEERHIATADEVSPEA